MLASLASNLRRWHRDANVDEIRYSIALMPLTSLGPKKAHQIMTNQTQIKVETKPIQGSENR